MIDIEKLCYDVIGAVYPVNPVNPVKEGVLECQRKN